VKILITGGAGFIGSRLAKKLAAQGAIVTVLDNLSEQVHGAAAEFSPDLQAIARCIKEDVCDSYIVGQLVADQEVIVHLAAETGTGQSMYAIERYERVNIRGTAILLDVLVNHRPHALRKLVVASSRAIYGEGEYLCGTHGTVYPAPRTAEAMASGRFEPVCPVCAGQVASTATSEDAPHVPSSFYGLTKQIQEQMVLMFAPTLGVDGIALRYQNVYGPGQSLSNPYTGILAVFSNLVRQRKPINVFEDGNESRDFVYIDDVIDATAACIDPAIRGVLSVNVGSGVRTSVLEVANAIVSYFKANVPVQVTGAFRVGDIRHNVADLRRIRTLCGFSPRWKFIDGLYQFLAWAEQFNVTNTGFERSLTELQDRGLLGSAKV
jgi:dTDP-L-rhamnose 4-epimerase